MTATAVNGCSGNMAFSIDCQQSAIADVGLGHAW